MKIGISSQQYPEKRNIIEQVDSCNYKLCRDWFLVKRKMLNFLPYKYNPKNSIDLAFSFNDFGLNKIDLYHFFNTINYSNNPWITTFETVIPRHRNILSHFKNDINKIMRSKRSIEAIKQLSRPNCKKLIAISKCSFNMQKHLLSFIEDDDGSIRQKMTILHPPQPINPYIETRPAGKKKDRLDLMIVGHQFFSKGGREIINTLREGVNSENWPIHLTIVSHIIPDSYATKTTSRDRSEVLAVLAKERKWITHYNELGHQEVLKMMAKSDIGLLPSYAETYGYSVLEFQSSRTPVITTNCRAFPEINNNEVGWVIDLDLDAFGEAKYQTAKEREDISKKIQAELYRILSEVVRNPDSLQKKGEGSLERISVAHSPEKYSRSLKDIYVSSILK